MGSGLGGLKPNIVIFEYDKEKKNLEPRELAQIIEDSLLLNKSVGVAMNFSYLDFIKNHEGNEKVFIDLWPFQVSSNGQLEYMSNFDSYTMVLQLGSIMNQQIEKKLAGKCKLRMYSFVEHEHEVNSEIEVISELLIRLRIAVDLKIVCLANLNIYKIESSKFLETSMQKLSDQKIKHIINSIRNPITIKGKRPKNQIGVGIPKIDMLRRQTFSNDDFLHSMPEPPFIKYQSPMEDGNDFDDPFSNTSNEGASGSKSSRHYTPKNMQDGRIFHSVKVDEEVDLACSPVDLRKNDKLYNFENNRSNFNGLESSPELEADYISTDEIENTINNRDNNFFKNFTSDIQNAIINELIKTYSVGKCNLIISTLPAPTLGTYNSRKASETYTLGLENIMSGIKTPTVLVHTRTLSVTTML
ncbi:hypothetical protein BB559_001937 [Furculomyces boomerangus]|nr:hypothetical protein BB559_001937 [Furculomyces boomerangus]PWA02786.1 hypothetical protein BB558_001077 [Smittium angustum]